MKKILFALAGLTILTGAAFTTSSPTHKSPLVPTANAVVKRVVVGIDSHGVPTVDQSQVDLNWVNGDSILWVPGPGVSAFSIQFATAPPFSQGTFTASAAGVS